MQIVNVKIRPFDYFYGRNGEAILDKQQKGFLKLDAYPHVFE